MYAVIFRAKINSFDESYSEMATRMQALAMSNYGCTEFVSVMEGTEEIAISYWSDLEQIKAWKQDAEHLAAQELGRSKWYSAYRIEIVEIIRSYSNDV